MTSRLPQRIAGRRAPTSGFTLIELVLVLVILAVLDAAALPRFIDSLVAAHEAIGNAFATAVTMVHAQWRVNGAAPAQDDVAGFGDGTVDVSVNGWPTDTQDANTIVPGATGVNRCARLLRALLLNGPEVSESPSRGFDLIPAAHAGSAAPRDPDADFWAQVPALNQCSFDYQPLANMSISYDCQSGKVVIDADSSG